MTLDCERKGITKTRKHGSRCKEVLLLAEMADSILRAVECWKCNKVFQTARDRKNHMGNTDHSCLRVMCPFCSRERLCRRSTPELRDHVKKEHARKFEDMPKDFFGEGNGFWLAMYPEDFAKLIKPPERRSRSCYGGQGTGEEDWETGWEFSSINPSYRKRARSSSLVCESRLVPNYQPQTTKKVKAYDPERPELPVPDISVNGVAVKQGGFETIFSDQEHTLWFTASVSADLTSDPRGMDGFATPEDDDTTTSWISLPFKNGAVSFCGVELLGISPRFLLQVKRGHSVAFTSARKTSTSTATSDEVLEGARPSAVPDPNSQSPEVDLNTFQDNFSQASLAESATIILEAVDVEERQQVLDILRSDVDDLMPIL
ncbi:hypothetical protein LOTGIDRAFT_163229 [Lottia gigantea]|uniref:C2H2-type domain-containing protein n=1 Tax=Lottia gigantea TaxID=225164 RepID=V3ZKL9_LOTGI|nr:hypothetical protein LOTGIDRAFT_163229 [Lottia gigantea]ESO91868.1 hypothetical protein LOTGIDRAFT_163229 [Lottia gigantea]